MPCVYAIKNIANDRIYIGSAINPNTRWRTHKSLLKKGKHANPFLALDYLKCGEEAFVFEILELCDKETMITREQFWIDIYYDKQDKCYNIRTKAKSNLGLRMTENTKLKMSLAHKGKKPHASVLQASILATKGKKKSDSTKEKMANAAKDRANQIGTEYYSEMSKNMWKDEQTRERLLAQRRLPRPTRRKKIAQYSLENALLSTYSCAEEASSITGLPENNIRRAASGKRKTTGNFIWRYV